MLDLAVCRYNVTTQRYTYYSNNCAADYCYPNNSDTKWDDHWKCNDKDEYHSRQHDDDTLDDYGDDNAGDDNTKHSKHNSWQYDHINYNDKRHDDGYYNSKCHDHDYYHNND
ncbi:hypothetical protein FOL46_005456 [Perkinsus olseni]|uniref:Uncharacterized protein n=1 Tax=Perkinsus olseni TaxID=32597 RepID=A0A7J6MSV1_PEROL|nr:hypothetical protein FOL46_005456 [Perkinsus olseni]